MKAAQPSGNTWPSNWLPRAIRPPGAIPVAIPAIIEPLAVVKIAPLYHIDAKSIIPMGGGMGRWRVARMAALDGGALRCRWRTDRRRYRSGFSDIRRRGRGLRNRRLRFIGITRTSAKQKHRGQQAGTPASASCTLKCLRFHSDHARPLVARVIRADPFDR